MSENQKNSSQSPLGIKIRSKIIEVTQNIPVGSSPGDLKKDLSLYYKEFALTPHSERKLLTRSVSILKKNQPALITALTELYSTFSSKDNYYKFITMQILGGLQDPGCKELFKKEIWEPISKIYNKPKVGHEEKKNYGQHEIGVKIKAVHGLGFIRTEESYQELEDIMLKHDINSVKVAAINTLMWNRGDTQEAANRLYKILPQAYHPYVQRPRFYRGMNQNKFMYSVLSWKRRWGGTNMELPKNPDYLKYIEERGGK